MKQKQLVTLIMAAMLAGTTLCAGAAAEDLVSGTTQKEVDTSRKLTVDGETLDKFVISVPNDVTNWDPNAQIDMNGVLYRDLVYQNLFIVHLDDIVPLVAKGYTEVDDRHWEVEIWDNVYDSEGNHLTADDVIFSYQTRIDAGTTAKYDAFESIEKTGDYTVMFTWTDAVETVGSLELILGETYLYTQAAYESHNFASDPIGTGPYKVTELVSGSKVVMEKRDDYWKKDDLTLYETTNIDTIEYDIITESSQNYIGLQTGSIDFSNNVPDENVKDFEEGGKFADQYEVYKKLGTLTYILACNESEGNIGANQDFRLAVYYALNNEAIAKVAGSFVGAQTFANPAGVDYSPEWAEFESYVGTFDDSLAKEYLEKSGYNGEKLTIVGESTEAAKSMMTMIQALLLNIGVQVEISAVDYPTVVATTTGTEGWDIALFYYGGGANISGMNRILNDDEWGTGCSFGFVNDDKLDELFDTAKTADGHSAESMSALVSYIIENAYFDMIAYPTTSIVYTNKLAELKMDSGNVIAPNACIFYLD